MTHREKIIAALEAWLDFFAWPETWTGELQRRATSSGPAPYRRVVCDTCQGSGKLRGGWLCRDCQGRGVYHVDEYTGQPVDTSETPWEDLLRGVVRCSRCAGTSTQCSRCNGSGVERAPFAGKVDMTGGVCNNHSSSRQGDRQLDQLERQHEQRDGLDCYRQHLEPAMCSLHVRDRPAHFVAAWTLVWQQQPAATLSAGARDQLERALRFLEGHVDPGFRLPGDVFAATQARQLSLASARGKQAARPAQRARNEAIRREYASGSSSMAAIASRYGVTTSQVSRIVNGRTGA